MFFKQNCLSYRKLREKTLELSIKFLITLFMYKNIYIKKFVCENKILKLF